MSQATELFEQSLDWLRLNYPRFHFFVERDIVWTVQLRVSELIRARTLPYRVFSDHPILPANRRGHSADIAILNAQDEVEVAAEFKFEPSHRRTDIWPTKFPVVFWNEDGVLGDVQRVHRFVDKGAARAAYAIFIDEGGAFRHRPPHPGSEWVDWEVGRDTVRPVSVLFARTEAVPPGAASKITTTRERVSVEAR